MERIPVEWDILERQTPLSDKEKLLLQETWAKLYQNIENVGTGILIRLFVNFPSSKQYFSQFKHMEDRKEMEESAQFRKHAGRIMNVINTMVGNLDNKEKLASVMKTTARPHAIKYKVEILYFKIVGGVALEFLGEAYPEVVTPEVGTAWTKFFAMMYTGFKGVYEEMGATDLLPASTG